MALARGRKSYDKRQLLARRDADLEARRAIANALKRRAGPDRRRPDAGDGRPEPTVTRGDAATMGPDTRQVAVGRRFLDSATR